MEDIVPNASGLSEQLIEYAKNFGPKLLMAIITLVVGFWIIKKLTNLIMFTMEKRGFDETLRIYLGRILGVVLKACLLLSVAGMLGVQTTSFLAILGAAGLAVGLALQGSLANFAGGILILTFRPFNVGDYIIAQGEEGAVTAIDVFNTTLTKLDNRRIIIPNGPLIGGNITNVSAEPMRRVDVSVGISYDDKIPKAQEALIAMAKAESKVLAEPAPMVGVVGFGDSSVDLTFRSWCKQEDYWDVYFELHEKTKEALDTAQVTIPFPQRDVHMFAEK